MNILRGAAAETAMEMVEQEEPYKTVAGGVVYLSEEYADREPSQPASNLAPTIFLSRDETDA